MGPGKVAMMGGGWMKAVESGHWRAHSSVQLSAMGWGTATLLLFSSLPLPLAPSLILHPEVLLNKSFPHQHLSHFGAFLCCLRPACGTAALPRSRLPHPTHALLHPLLQDALCCGLFPAALWSISHRFGADKTELGGASPILTTKPDAEIIAQGVRSALMSFVLRAALSTFYFHLFVSSPMGSPQVSLSSSAEQLSRHVAESKAVMKDTEEREDFGALRHSQEELALPCRLSEELSPGEEGSP